MGGVKMRVGVLYRITQAIMIILALMLFYGIFILHLKGVL